MIFVIELKVPLSPKKFLAILRYRKLAAPSIATVGGGRKKGGCEGRGSTGRNIKWFVMRDAD